MTVLNYVHHINVNGYIDTLDKIRQFAVAQGWTQEVWQSGYRWDMISPYGFTIVDANHGYLCLSVTGYGTQSLIVRMESFLDTEGRDTLNMCMADSAVVDLEQTHPYAQHRITHGNSDFQSSIGGMNIGEAVYDDLWVYGDSKWIGASLSMDGVFCQHLHFGSFHMFDASPTQGQTVGLTLHLGDVPWSSWATNLQVSPPYWNGYRGQYFGGGGRNTTAHDIYWGGRSCFYSTTVNYKRSNIFPWDDVNLADTYLWAGGAFGNDCYLNLGAALRANNFGGKRLLLRQVHFIQRSSDSLYEPVCKTPIYFLNFSGLTIGEVITQGSEQFMTFPFGPYSSRLGLAVQIA